MKVRNLVVGSALFSVLMFTGGCAHNSSASSSDADARKAFTQGGAMPADVQAKMAAAKAAAAKKYGNGSQSQ